MFREIGEARVETLRADGRYAARARPSRRRFRPVRWMRMVSAGLRLIGEGR
jgi:hypothetical protein